jgi:Fur family iron response transcriptional regulator
MPRETNNSRPYTDALARLRDAGLRPTRQRLALAKILFQEGDRHVTAEELHALAREASVSVSLATIYNTLNQFRDSGLLREVVVGPGRSYFDTNTSAHHHFFVEPEGALVDIPENSVALAALPAPPDGTRMDRVDVIVRVTRD